jgi:ankyrin repeat protein
LAVLDLVETPPPIFLEIMNKRIPISAIDKIVTAVQENDVNSLAKLVVGRSDVSESNFGINAMSRKNVLPYDSLTLMHIAAYSNASECLLFLYNVCKISIHVNSASGYKPFHYACLGGSLECAHIIEALYEQNENRKNESLQDLFDFEYKNAKINLPYLAAIGGSPGIMTLIFEKGYDFESYSPNQRQFSNQAMIHVIKTQNVECLEIILRHLRPSRSSADKTPLMLAVINNQTEAVSLLLKSKCDPDARTKENDTALSLACFMPNYEAVKMIAEVLVEVDIPDDIKDVAAVHWICQSRDPRIAEIILDKGIDVNRLDKDGRSGPFYMLDAPNEDDILKIFNLLYDYGFNVNIRGKQQNSILGEFLLGIKKSYKIIDWLLSKGANLNVLIIKKDKAKRETCKQFMEKAAESDPKLKKILEKYI